MAYNNQTNDRSATKSTDQYQPFECSQGIQEIQSLRADKRVLESEHMTLKQGFDLQRARIDILQDENQHLRAQIAELRFENNIQTGQELAELKDCLATLFAAAQSVGKAPILAKEVSVVHIQQSSEEPERYDTPILLPDGISHVSNSLGQYQRQHDQDMLNDSQTTELSRRQSPFLREQSERPSLAPEVVRQPNLSVPNQQFHHRVQSEQTNTILPHKNHIHTNRVQPRTGQILELRQENQQPTETNSIPLSISTQGRRQANMAPPRAQRRSHFNRPLLSAGTSLEMPPPQLQQATRNDTSPWFAWNGLQQRQSPSELRQNQQVLVPGTPRPISTPVVGSKRGFGQEIAYNARQMPTLTVTPMRKDFTPNRSASVRIMGPQNQSRTPQQQYPNKRLRPFEPSPGTAHITENGMRDSGWRFGPRQLL